MTLSSGARRAVSRTAAFAVAALLAVGPGAGQEAPRAKEPGENGRSPRAAWSLLSDEGDYVIGVEDLIHISVWKNPDLTVTVPVRPDGKISLPLIDDVTAAGLTPLQLKADLTDRWKAFLSSPEVSVIVQEINSYKVFVVGEVVRPGELRLKGRTRLLQVIALAGGFTTFANREKIIVIRHGAGGAVRREVNFNKVVSGARAEDNLLIEPGDTIVVP